jgi:hypothetical protein
MLTLPADGPAFNYDFFGLGVKESIHRRDAEFAEIGVFFVHQELFTLRPQRLRGKISEFLFTPQEHQSLQSHRKA